MNERTRLLFKRLIIESEYLQAKFAVINFQLGRKQKYFRLSNLPDLVEENLVNKADKFRIC